ncbi:D-alanine--D-alanine ligase [Candidatus Marinamargulisbacteria bacterium SCGC AG-439-L15]|nr:D-alanine--D-alanine ligase [Candidatus Marinamargulisbacteria bacterium SCGC AG-439-L15]
MAIENKHIAVLYGGISNEREVSLRSGQNVYTALKTLGYSCELIDTALPNALDKISCDIAFIALHGKGGEDGTIQSYLDQKNIPYTGSNAKASSLAMNKLKTKALIQQHKLPTPQYHALDTYTPDTLSFPVILKPIAEGSSRGVQLVDSPDSLHQHLQSIQKQDYFLEDYIPGKEITVGLLEQNNTVIALPVLELDPDNTFYDYEAKYTRGKTTFIIPSTLSKELNETCQLLGKTVHNLLGCKGFSRVDMRIHPEQGPFILEINTIPGLTELSDIPAQAKAAGISFEQLIETILKNAL